MNYGRVWEFNPDNMCKMEIEFWNDVFGKHEPLNLKAIYKATGLTPTTISKKLKGNCHLTLPQYEILKEFFDDLDPEWKEGKRYGRMDRGLPKSSTKGLI